MHPILFHLGFFTIYSYGLMVALGFAACTLLAAKTGPKFGIHQDRVVTLSIVILISGIVGARLLHVMLNLGEFIKDPLEIFMIMHGGLAFYGGAAAALLCSLAYLKISGTPILQAADLIAPYVALGHALGRMGCFLNGCCFGKPADGTFGVAFSDGILRYPTQVYSAAGLLILYCFLRVILEYRDFKGQVFFSYLILYSAGRFYLEYFRGDNPAVWLSLTLPQVFSIIMLPIGIIGYLISARYGRR